MKNRMHIIAFAVWGLCVAAVPTGANAINPSFKKEIGFTNSFEENRGFTRKAVEQPVAEADNRSASPPAGPPIGGGAPVGDGIPWFAALTLIYGIYLLGRKKRLLERFINIFTIN